MLARSARFLSSQARQLCRRAGEHTPAGSAMRRNIFRSGRRHGGRLRERGRVRASPDHRVRRGGDSGLSLLPGRHRSARGTSAFCQTEGQRSLPDSSACNGCSNRLRASTREGSRSHSHRTGLIQDRPRSKPPCQSGIQPAATNQPRPVFPSSRSCLGPSNSTASVAPSKAIAMSLCVSQKSPWVPRNSSAPCPSASAAAHSISS